MTPAAATISEHVCRMLSDRNKARSINQMAELLKDCPPDQRGNVAETIAKVADSFFPQPQASLTVKSLNHRHNRK